MSHIPIAIRTRSVSYDIPVWAISDSTIGHIVFSATITDPVKPAELPDPEVIRGHHRAHIRSVRGWGLIDRSVPPCAPCSTCMPPPTAANAQRDSRDQPRNPEGLRTAAARRRRCSYLGIHTALPPSRDPAQPSPPHQGRRSRFHRSWHSLAIASFAAAVHSRGLLLALPSKRQRPPTPGVKSQTRGDALARLLPPDACSRAT